MYVSGDFSVLSYDVFFRDRSHTHEKCLFNGCRSSGRVLEWFSHKSLQENSSERVASHKVKLPNHVADNDELVRVWIG